MSHPELIGYCKEQIRNSAKRTKLTAEQIGLGMTLDAKRYGGVEGGEVEGGGVEGVQA
jgi:hypothetical protein